MNRKNKDLEHTPDMEYFSHEHSRQSKVDSNNSRLSLLLNQSNSLQQEERENKPNGNHSSISKIIDSKFILDNLVEIPKEIIVRIETKPDLYGIALLSQNDMKKLNLKEREIIVVEDRNAGAHLSLLATTSQAVEDGIIQIDDVVYTNSGFEFENVSMRKYPTGLQIISDSTLLVKTKEEVFSTIADLRNDFYNWKSFLSNYVIHKDLEMNWREKKLSIKVDHTLPHTTEDFIGVFDFSHSTSLTFKPDGIVNFNAILLIDVSKSMIGRDLEVTNIRPIVEDMKQNMANKKLNHYLEEFKEGNYIKRKTGAAFAALLFLNEKIKRGLDETVSIMTFSDYADVLKTNGKPYINSNFKSQETMHKMVDQVLGYVEDRTGVGTNMATAIEKCDDIIKQLPKYKRKNPLLVILLTDGFDTSMRLKEAVISTFSKYDNVLLNAVGIWPYVNRKELEEISKLFGGEVFLPENLEELSDWYKKLAKDLQILIDEVPEWLFFLQKII